MGKWRGEVIYTTVLTFWSSAGSDKYQVLTTRPPGVSLLSFLL